MSAANLARPITLIPSVAVAEPRPRVTSAAAAPRLVVAPACVPQLRVLPLQSDTQHRRFARVPTHAVGVHPEHREYPRATLKLPLRLRGINGVPEPFPITLVTRDVSSTGVYFLCPKQVAVGACVQLEIVLISRPLGRGNVVAGTSAHVRRIESAATPGWYGVAASFDDVHFDRDDGVPTRFLDL